MRYLMRNQLVRKGIIFPENLNDVQDLYRQLDKQNPCEEEIVNIFWQESGEDYTGVLEALYEHGVEDVLGVEEFNSLVYDILMAIEFPQ